MRYVKSVIVSASVPLPPVKVDAPIASASALSNGGVSLVVDSPVDPSLVVYPTDVWVCYLHDASGADGLSGEQLVSAGLPMSHATGFALPGSVELDPPSTLAPGSYAAQVVLGYPD